MKGSNAEGVFDFSASGCADPGLYFSNAAHDIRERLLSDGAVIIRAADRCKDPGEFEKAIVAMGFETRDYVGGSSPRSTIQGKVMEATRTPPDWSVILHQEMAYVKRPPRSLRSFAWNRPEKAANLSSATCASWSNWLIKRP